MPAKVVSPETVKLPLTTASALNSALPAFTEPKMVVSSVEAKPSPKVNLLPTVKELLVSSVKFLMFASLVTMVAP